MRTRRLYLSVSETPATTGVRRSIHLTDRLPSNPLPVTPTRTSPIYQVYAGETAVDFAALGNSKVLFLFTLDSFFLLGLVQDILKGSPLLERVFISHGLASIVVIARSQEDVKAVLTAANGHVVAHEIWHLRDSEISKTEFETHRQATSVAGAFKWPLDRLDHEEGVFFGGAAHVLSTSLQTAQQFIPQYVPLLDAVATDVKCVLYTLLFLEAKCEDVELRAVLQPAYDDKQDLEECLSNLSATRKDAALSIITVHQLKDEIVQMSAILRTFAQQAIGGIPPLLESSCEPGPTSLLGVGAAFAALFATYDFVQRTFSRVPFDRIVRRTFVSRSAPPLQANPAAYEEWFHELADAKYQSVDNAGGLVGGNVTRHLLYFSNRLGFRETRHSISAAHQTLFMGWNPEWTLCTLTHEFMHAHARGLLACLYHGFNDPVAFDELYKIHQVAKTEPTTPDNLYQFLQLLLLDVAHKWYNTHWNARSDPMSRTPMSKTLEKPLLLATLKKSYHDIDELMVHVLDYHYFYSADPDVYVEAIWASWLTLPVVIARIPEYIMRTIAAVASGRAATRKDRFDWCLNKVKDKISHLRFSPLIDGKKIDLIIGMLNDSNIVARMRAEFTDVWAPWVDAVLRLLLSREVKESLKREDSPLFTLQDNERYAYEVQEGSFLRTRIQNPTLFLSENLKSVLQSDRTPYDEAQVEFHTVWLFSALATALHAGPQEGDRP